MKKSYKAKNTSVRSDVPALLSTLSADEHKKFGKFLGNPQTSGSSLLPELFSPIARHYPVYSSAVLQPKKIFAEACKGKRSDSVSYRK
ncbi:MAG: hypothetical protein K1X85_05465 [Ignavibacteria bacterium]|nr:hypothetical protein [Ignavibacteria bacterium]